MSFREQLQQAGITRGRAKWIIRQRTAGSWFLRPYFSREQRRRIVIDGDPVRYGTLMLALAQVKKEGIPGKLAECGVYQGVLSKFIHEQLPDRELFLFDTFEGFDERDTLGAGDGRFRDTSEEKVLRRIGDTKNITSRKGYFPETAKGLEAEKFAFVMMDFDKFEPTMAALEFFYDKVSPGGFIFVHDYSSPESGWACSRALDEFLAGKPERPVLIPDCWGSALFRKI